MVVESLLLELKRNARSYILVSAFSPATISSYIELVLREEKAGTFIHAAHLILKSTCVVGKAILAPPTSGKTEMYMYVPCPLIP